MEKISFVNFRSKFKLLIEKREFWGKLKKKCSTALFESVAMDKLKKNGFCV